jgi:hypothetical protein
MMIIYIAIDRVEVKPFKVKTLAKPFLGVDLPCMSDVAETWWNAGGIFFACPDTDSPTRSSPDVKPGGTLPARHKHSRLWV